LRQIKKPLFLLGWCYNKPSEERFFYVTKGNFMSENWEQGCGECDSCLAGYGKEDCTDHQETVEKPGENR